MSIFQNDPFNAASTFRGCGCGCGQHASQAEHHALSTKANAPDEGQLLNRSIQGGILSALFPNDMARRQFINSVGSSTALAAIASLFPLGALTAMAQDKAPLEKKDLKIGFIPITCATPLIMRIRWAFMKSRVSMYRWSRPQVGR